MGAVPFAAAGKKRGAEEKLESAMEKTDFGHSPSKGTGVKLVG